MPSQTITTITHAALTNHRIAARPDEPLPDAAFRANTDSGLIDLTAAAGARSQPDSITLLQAYATLIRDGHLELKPKLNDLLDALSRTNPTNAIVLSALARRAMSLDSAEASEQAIRFFKAAIQKNPAVSDNYILLSAVYARLGRSQEAIPVLLEGMRLSPYAKEFPESLAVQYMESGKYGDALRIIRKGLEVFPGDLVLRALLKKVSSATLDGC
jgi:tetratricopeptide (TPR) repeat protein